MYRYVYIYIFIYSLVPTTLWWGIPTRGHSHGAHTHTHTDYFSSGKQWLGSTNHKIVFFFPADILQVGRYIYIYILIHMYIYILYPYLYFALVQGLKDSKPTFWSPLKPIVSGVCIGWWCSILLARSFRFAMVGLSWKYIIVRCVCLYVAPTNTYNMKGKALTPDHNKSCVSIYRYVLYILLYSYLHSHKDTQIGYMDT